MLSFKQLNFIMRNMKVNAHVLSESKIIHLPDLSSQTIKTKTLSSIEDNGLLCNLHLKCLNIKFMLIISCLFLLQNIRNFFHIHTLIQCSELRDIIILSKLCKLQGYFLSSLENNSYLDVEHQ